MTFKKCAHDSCECEVNGAGYDYCSVYCEEDAKGTPHETEPGDCRCGHAGCGSGNPSIDEDLEQRV